ncbi:hypothetical protein [Streptomyces sp. NPDC003877]
MTVPLAEGLVLRTAERHGVPGPVAQELLAGSRPCLHLVGFQGLTLAQQEEARPAARTGGLPFLPDGVDLPEGREPLVLTVDCADRDDILDDFEDAVRSAAAGGASHGVAVQLGGFSSPWQSAPDEGDLVLLAQIHGQSIDPGVYTQTLIVGTREDIAGRRYEALGFEQQV